MRHRLPIAVAMLFAVSCMRPSTNDATSVLSRTAANLGEISSGELDLRFETSMKGEDASGFTLEGPFSLRSKGPYPVAEFVHTRFDGDNEERTGRFLSTGTAAYVVRDGRSKVLPDAQIASSGIGSLVKRDSEDDGLGRLNIDGWIRGEPEVAAGGLVGGVDTDKVTAQLDTPAVLNGLIELGQALGGGDRLQMVPANERDRVRRAVKKAELQVWSGKDDRMLRKLIVEVVFGLDDEELATKLDELSGATIRLETSVTDINEPVEVDAPG